MTTLATRTLRGLPVLILKEATHIEIVPVVEEQGWEWTPDQIAEAQGIISVFLAAQNSPAPAQGNPQAQPSAPWMPRWTPAPPAPPLNAKNHSQWLANWAVPVVVWTVVVAFVALTWRRR